MKKMSICAYCTLALFIFHYHFAPSIHAITVEEQAGSKNKRKKRVYRDNIQNNDREEIFGKVVEKREMDGRPMKKDPRLACLISLVIPGGGHIYLRKDLKGIAFCLATGAGYSVTGYYLYRSFVQDKGPDFKSKVIVSGLLFFLSSIVHVVGVVEAYSDADEINKKSNYSKTRMKTPFVAKIEFE